MTTVLEARKSDGTLIGRCDSKCHYAKGPKCNCICQGKNHGVGLEKAIENTQEIFNDLAEAHIDHTYIKPTVQLNLFGGQEK